MDVIKAMALRAALELGVFTPLEDGPLTAKELANSLGLKPRRLDMLLYQLVASKFLELHDDQFTNTPIAAHYFIQGRPDYYGGIHEYWTEMWGALFRSADSIRDDEPKAKMDFAGMTKEELGAILRGLHGMAVVAGRTLAEYPQFTDAKRVVDIGGGSGGVLIGLCEEHPHLHAT